MADPSVSLAGEMWRGFRSRCPCCGKGLLFNRFLKVVERCPNCGEELFHHRADDFSGLSGDHGGRPCGGTSGACGGGQLRSSGELATIALASHHCRRLARVAAAHQGRRRRTTMASGNGWLRGKQAAARKSAGRANCRIKTTADPPAQRGLRPRRAKNPSDSGSRPVKWARCCNLNMTREELWQPFKVSKGRVMRCTEKLIRRGKE